LAAAYWSDGKYNYALVGRDTGSTLRNRKRSIRNS